MSDIALDSNHGMPRDQVELIKRTIARGTSDDELQLFCMTAKRMGLDPFAKQIYAVKRWDSKTRTEVMAIQVGIDGFRSVASRTGALDGQDGPYWCGPDGVWRDVWLGDSPPAAAKVMIWRKGASRPFAGIATYRSYVQTTKDGNPSGRWGQMADVMLAKCAEALGLRKAFPSELSGVYAPEEMDQADNGERIVVKPQLPRATSAGQLPAGKLADTEEDFDVDVVSIALRACETVEDLRRIGKGLVNAPRSDRDMLREIYAERMAFLKASPPPPQNGAEP